jgi:hypothetical protein
LSTQCPTVRARPRGAEAILAKIGIPFAAFEGMEHTNVLDGSNKWPTRFGRMRRMPLPAETEATLRDLRMRYNAAYSAYQSCLIALNEAAMSGQPPSKDLLEKEADALAELNEARAKLIAAIAQG